MTSLLLEDEIITIYRRRGLSRPTDLLKMSEMSLDAIRGLR